MYGLTSANQNNVKISGCEFYQNKGDSYLIHTVLGSSFDSSIHNSFDMDNCSIYGNISFGRFQL